MKFKKKDVTIIIFLIISLNFMGLFLKFTDRSINLNSNNKIPQINTYISANIAIVSEDDTNWNIGDSSDSSIVVDNLGTIYVFWDDNTDGPWGIDTEIMYVSYSEDTGWSNITIISDGFEGYYWNDGSSLDPSVFIDNDGIIHVVWEDDTDGPWGTDTEIMYCSSSDGVIWSNATVISDDDTHWNDDFSFWSSIFVDNLGTIHIVWYDNTDGPWGADIEIMYCSSSDGVTWSNVTVISDDDTHWNNGDSGIPSIFVDNLGTIHVVWTDFTDGEWGVDREIMYCSSSDGVIWSNATVISDDDTHWNNDVSASSIIFVDNLGTIHVVWHDYTDGEWGVDREIMYCSSSDGVIWSNATVISDDDTHWNSGDSGIPSIFVDNLGTIHVVWTDDTDGPWGTDTEIMYCSSSDGVTWSNATAISDDDTHWNNGESMDSTIIVDNLGTIHVVWSDDTDGSWGTDSEIMYLKLFEDDIAPILTNPSDIKYEEGMNGNFISWTAIDLNPNIYTITQNDVMVSSGTWLSGVPIIFNIDGLGIGIYEFKINVIDQIGQSTIDIVTVEVSAIFQWQLGDVNHNGEIDIVDALITAQYYVGLDPQPFYPKEADVNNNGVIDILDALLIAQAYVGLIELTP